MGGDESEVRATYGKRQVSSFTGWKLAAEYTREGEGHADEGWFIQKHVVSKICTALNDVLFEMVVKSS